MEAFCETISVWRGVVHDPSLSLDKKRQIQQQFSWEIAAFRGRLCECRNKAMDLGITRRYRARSDFLRMIGMFLLKRPVSPSRKKETMRYLLRDHEIEVFSAFYGRYPSTTHSLRTRARHMLRDIATNIYISDIRATLTRCGIPFGFRKKEKMMDLLCLLWFGGEVIQPSYTIITATKENCLICMESVASSGVRLPCSCNNVYHKECADRWSHVSFTCPTCRKIMLEDVSLPGHHSIQSTS